MVKKFAVVPKSVTIWFHKEQYVELSVGDYFRILDEDTIEGEAYYILMAVGKDEEDTVPLILRTSLLEDADSEEQAWKLGYSFYMAEDVNNRSDFEYPEIVY